MGKKIFVTVGTTKFDRLIAATSSKDILDVFQKLGYTFIQYQTGTGDYKKQRHEIITLSYNKYFHNFEEEIEKADLVISHAGAGSCLQVLKKKKPLLVVINDELMDNHQLELAEQLQNDGYAYCCTCDDLKATLKKNFHNLKPYPQPQMNLFAGYIDKCIGFTN